MSYILIIALAVLLAVNLTIGIFSLLALRRRANDRAVEEQLRSALETIRALETHLVKEQRDGMAQIGTSLEQARDALNRRLAEGTEVLDRRMAVVGDIQNRLGQLDRQARNIENIGQNIQSLADLLRPPKARGVVGEQLLDNLLSQILPVALYELQYTIPGSRDRVDAVVKLGQRLLVIDSKFPLDSYRRIQAGEGPDKAEAVKDFNKAIKKHADDIAGKYIRPDLGTTDIALMYIPAEAVYHYLVTTDEALPAYEHALRCGVIPGSPGVLYAFLAAAAKVLAEAGLTADRRRLIDGLNRVRVSIDELIRMSQQTQSSLNSAARNVEKILTEEQRLSQQLREMCEPEADDSLRLPSPERQ